MVLAEIEIAAHETILIVALATIMMIQMITMEDHQDALNAVVGNVMAEVAEVVVDAVVAVDLAGVNVARPTSKTFSKKAKKFWCK